MPLYDSPEESSMFNNEKRRIQELYSQENRLMILDGKTWRPMTDQEKFESKIDELAKLRAKWVKRIQDAKENYKNADHSPAMRKYRCKCCGKFTYRQYFCSPDCKFKYKHEMQKVEPILKEVVGDKWQK